jgi:hypothetical protein
MRMPFDRTVLMPRRKINRLEIAPQQPLSGKASITESQALAIFSALILHKRRVIASMPCDAASPERA